MDDDGLAFYERVVKRFEAMMNIATTMWSALEDKSHFWTDKHVNWMWRTLKRFELRGGEIEEIYHTQHSVFMPNLRVLNLWTRAQALTLRIRQFAELWDGEVYCPLEPVMMHVPAWAHIPMGRPN